jgi:hypothetical protein
MTDAQPATASERKYDKGERRFKHVGRGSMATIELDDSHPKKWIGKCPSTLNDADRERLLREAITAPNGDRELSAPKKLYVVHDGAIYEAQTSDHGRTYHGYPYKGRLSQDLLRSLRSMATSKGSLEAFEAWVKRHIEIQGGSA